MSKTNALTLIGNGEEQCYGKTGIGGQNEGDEIVGVLRKYEKAWDKEEYINRSSIGKRIRSGSVGQRSWVKVMGQGYGSRPKVKVVGQGHGSRLWVKAEGQGRGLRAWYKVMGGRGLRLWVVVVQGHGWSWVVGDKPKWRTCAGCGGCRNVIFV